MYSIDSRNGKVTTRTPEKLANKSEKKGRNFNCTKTEFMVFIRWNRPTCKLRIDDIKIP